jgi:hypothetical protein
MYRIKRATVHLLNGDRINRKEDIIVKDLSELETKRSEILQKFDAQKVNLVYEEIEESGKNHSNE